MTPREEVLAEMVSTGRSLALHWGHPPWSESWARLVAETLLDVVSAHESRAYRDAVDAETVICGDCVGIAGPSCADYHGHGCSTLGELLDAFGNPHVAASATDDTQQGGKDGPHG